MTYKKNKKDNNYNIIGILKINISLNLLNNKTYNI